MWASLRLLWSRCLVAGWFLGLAQLLGLLCLSGLLLARQVLLLADLLCLLCAALRIGN